MICFGLRCRHVLDLKYLNHMQTQKLNVLVLQDGILCSPTDRKKLKHDNLSEGSKFCSPATLQTRGGGYIGLLQRLNSPLVLLNFRRQANSFSLDLSQVNLILSIIITQYISDTWQDLFILRVPSIMFSYDTFEFHDSNQTFSEISGMGAISESLYNAEASTSKTEFPRRKRNMTKETIEKRKQQNRTAQKAFRERKERHLRDIESQLSYKQQQIQGICGRNHYLEEKCVFLSNQCEILEKKFEEAQRRLKSFEEFSIKQTLPGRYEPLQEILGSHSLDNSANPNSALQ